jgi:thiazole synthase
MTTDRKSRESGTRKVPPPQPEGHALTVVTKPPAREVQSSMDTLVIGDTRFRSRLIVGTGKYTSNDVMVKAIRASGAQMVTVAVRRVDLDRSRDEGILHHLDPKEFFLLANTAGCYTADEAIRFAHLARASGFNEWLKLEVIGDERTLVPDTHATVEAARRLVEEGFKVMAYTSDDIVTALRLEDAGVVAVMPYASPIGSGLGVVNPYFIREIKRRCEVPIIVDAGVGTASDACVAMEQGMDGVLMNTAIAAATDPVAMAEAMKHGVRAGRLAFLAGRMQPREIAVPSSPARGMLD